jgi:UDP-N-acetyl-D-galactosamine dehydrogenase
LVHDPLADAEAAARILGVALSPLTDMTGLDAMIIAVGHQAYRSIPFDDLIGRLSPDGCIVDVKAVLDPEAVRQRGVRFWRL